MLSFDYDIGCAVLIATFCNCRIADNRDDFEISDKHRASGQNVRRDFDVRRVRVVHDNARRVIVKLNCFEEIPKTSSVSLIQFFRAECVHTVCREVIIRGHDRNGLISRPQSVRDVSRECGFTRSANTLQNDYASHWFVPFTVSL